MTKEYFRDPYGCTASILRHPSGKSLLSVRIPQGDLVHSKTYSTYRGARVALGKLSDGMMELTKREEN